MGDPGTEAEGEVGAAQRVRARTSTAVIVACPFREHLGGEATGSLLSHGAWLHPPDWSTGSDKTKGSSHLVRKAGCYTIERVADDGTVTASAVINIALGRGGCADDHSADSR